MRGDDVWLRLDGGGYLRLSDVAEFVRALPHLGDTTVRLLVRRHSGGRSLLAGEWAELDDAWAWVDDQIAGRVPRLGQSPPASAGWGPLVAAVLSEAWRLAKSSDAAWWLGELEDRLDRLVDSGWQPPRIESEEEIAERARLVRDAGPPAGGIVGHPLAGWAQREEERLLDRIREPDA
jgi:hypothetical protein